MSRSFLGALLFATAAHGSPWPLPEGPIIAGYTNQASAAEVVASVRNGVNVLIWSFIELSGELQLGILSSLLLPSLVAHKCAGSAACCTSRWAASEGKDNHFPTCTPQFTPTRELQATSPTIQRKVGQTQPI
jgi:hypothetical protein